MRWSTVLSTSRAHPWARRENGYCVPMLGVATVFTAGQLFRFTDITVGKHISPVLAATEHVLVATQVAIDAGQVSEEGYVYDDYHTAKLNARSDPSPETKPGVRPATGQRVRGDEVVTPSIDPISGIRYEISTPFTQTPIYQSDVGGWVPSIISWP